MTIFELSREGRRAAAQMPKLLPAINDIPEQFLRLVPPLLPEVSELQAVRHYTRLSRKNFSIDTHFYPLGSCTMKYNPRAHRLAFLDGFISHHPYAPAQLSQGVLRSLYELQQYLLAITGMHDISLTPMAGAQGELAGVLIIKKYHAVRGDNLRTEILIPDSAHGTNPASAVMCGFTVREIPTDAHGDIDLEKLRAAVGPQTAGIMLTNPSTLGVFERNIAQVAEIVHAAGGLLYYDGANLNAIVGKVRPGDMGFDVLHLNLHKTFSTPHGGGGPGAGPVAVNARLAPYLPVPRVTEKSGQFSWVSYAERPDTIGQLSTFAGNVGVLLRAYIYIRLVGREGLQRIADFATLNANYLLKRLQTVGFTAAFPLRRASHEFILTLKTEKAQYGITALDIAKRLLDYGFHAPTIYFPLSIPECLLIEPTETEDKQTLDLFVQACCDILHEAQTAPARLKQAPLTMPVSRLDEVKAVRELNIVWRKDKNLIKE